MTLAIEYHLSPKRNELSSIMEETDTMETLVAESIDAWEVAILKQKALTEQDPHKVLPELFFQVEELVNGVDEEELLKSATLPLPENTREIIAAIRLQDVDMLTNAFQKRTLGQLIGSLFVLIVALRDARSRLIG